MKTNYTIFLDYENLNTMKTLTDNEKEQAYPDLFSSGLTKRELFAKDITIALINNWDKVNTNWIAVTDIPKLCDHALEITDILFEKLNHCPDVSYGNCCHPKNCQARKVLVLVDGSDSNPKKQIKTFFLHVQTEFTVPIEKEESQDDLFYDLMIELADDGDHDIAISNDRKWLTQMLKSKFTIKRNI